MAGAVLRVRDARRLRSVGMLPPLFPTSFKCLIVGFSLRKAKKGRSLRVLLPCPLTRQWLWVPQTSPRRKAETLGLSNSSAVCSEMGLRLLQCSLCTRGPSGVLPVRRGATKPKERGLFMPGIVQPPWPQHTQGPGQVWCSLRLASEGFSMGKDTNYPRGAAKTLGQGVMRGSQPPSSLPSPWDGICLPARSLPAPASYPGGFAPVGRTPWAPGLAGELLVSVGREPVCRAAAKPQSPARAICGQEGARGIWVLGRVSQAAAPWSLPAPSLLLGEDRGPLPSDLATFWDAGWWLQLAVRVGSFCSHPRSLGSLGCVSSCRCG